MGKIRVTQVKSHIKRPSDQRATLVALGLGRINKSAEHEGNPQIMGMIKKVQHLVKTETL